MKVLIFVLILWTSTLAAEQHKELPSGWTLQYNEVSKKYRWINSNGYAAMCIDCRTKQDAIDDAWKFLEFSKKEAERNWKTVK